MTGANVATCMPHTRGHAVSGLETAMRVCMWALSMHALPTVGQIRMQWGVSRATAYRWRAALADTLGQPS